MPSAYTWPKRHLTAVATAVFLASAGFPASAGAKAPIVYASNGATAEPAARTTGPAGAIDKTTQRIEFRYPGSPAGAARVEMASATLPKSTSPVVEQGATQLPQFAPAATPFDAASTVAMLGAAKQPVVAAAALEPLVAAALPAAPSFGAPVMAGQGVAIVYEDEFEGLPTANGEIFSQAALSAAHPSLPLPSLVQVTNPANGKQVVVRVNDRGPFEDNADLQVSRLAARELGFEGAGKATLTLKVLGQTAPEVEPVKAASEPKPVLMSLSAPQKRSADELLGGDELAGGTSWTPEPVKTRADVKWPEPPAEWGVKAVKTAAPVATKITAAVGGSHYVQLASFSDIGNAEALYRGLQGDLPVEIVPARVNGTDYFRVRVGPLASRETAQELRDRLNAEGKGDGRVVSAE